MTAPTPSELKAWRADHKITQEDAARLLPCPIGTWRAWEQGRRSPPDYFGRCLRDMERELSIRRAGNKTRPL